MPPLFLPRPLFDRELVQIIIGRALAAGEAIPAKAPHSSPASPPGPGSSRQDGTAGMAEGILLHATADEQDRLLWSIGDGHEFVPVQVETESGPVNASGPCPVAKASAQPSQHLTELISAPRPVVLEAAREAIAHYGSIPPRRMARLWPGIMIRAHMRARAKAAPPPARRLGHGFGTSDVELLEVKRPWTGYFALEEHVLRHRLFDGGWSEPVKRATFVTGDAATVLPYDPQSDTVLLIEQFRPAMFVRGDPNPWGIEAVAGRLDQETDPETCARREAREEAGLTLGRVEMIADYYTSPGFAAERVVSFIAEADLSDEGGLHGNPGEHEDIRAFTLGLDEALAGIASAEIDDAPAILSLFWLQQNRARLRREWG